MAVHLSTSAVALAPPPSSATSSPFPRNPAPVPHNPAPLPRLPARSPHLSDKIAAPRRCRSFSFPAPASAPHSRAASRCCPAHGSAEGGPGEAGVEIQRAEGWGTPRTEGNAWVGTRGGEGAAGLKIQGTEGEQQEEEWRSPSGEDSRPAEAAVLSVPRERGVLRMPEGEAYVGSRAREAGAADLSLPRDRVVLGMPEGVAYVGSRAREAETVENPLPRDRVVLGMPEGGMHVGSTAREESNAMLAWTGKSVLQAVCSAVLSGSLVLSPLPGFFDHQPSAFAASAATGTATAATTTSGDSGYHDFLFENHITYSTVDHGSMEGSTRSMASSSSGRYTYAFNCQDNIVAPSLAFNGQDDSVPSLTNTPSASGSFAPSTIIAPFTTIAPSTSSLGSFPPTSSVSPSFAYYSPSLSSQGGGDFLSVSPPVTYTALAMPGGGAPAAFPSLEQLLAEQLAHRFRVMSDGELVGFFQQLLSAARHTGVEGGQQQNGQQGVQQTGQQGAARVEGYSQGEQQEPGQIERFQGQVERLQQQIERFQQQDTPLGIKAGKVVAAAAALGFTVAAGVVALRVPEGWEEEMGDGSWKREKEVVEKGGSWLVGVGDAGRGDGEAREGKDGRDGWDVERDGREEKDGKEEEKDEKQQQQEEKQRQQLWDETRKEQEKGQEQRGVGGKAMGKRARGAEVGVMVDTEESGAAEGRRKGGRGELEGSEGGGEGWRGVRRKRWVGLLGGDEEEEGGWEGRGVARGFSDNLSEGEEEGPVRQTPYAGGGAGAGGSGSAGAGGGGFGGGAAAVNAADIETAGIAAAGDVAGKKLAEDASTRATGADSAAADTTTNISRSSLLTLPPSGSDTALALPTSGSEASSAVAGPWTDMVVPVHTDKGKGEGEGRNGRWEVEASGGGRTGRLDAGEVASQKEEEGYGWERGRRGREARWKVGGEMREVSQGDLTNLEVQDGWREGGGRREWGDLRDGVGKVAGEKRSGGDFHGSEIAGSNRVARLEKKGMQEEGPSRRRREFVSAREISRRLITDQPAKIMSAVTMQTAAAVKPSAFVGSASLKASQHKRLQMAAPSRASSAGVRCSAVRSEPLWTPNSAANSGDIWSIKNDLEVPHSLFMGAPEVMAGQGAPPPMLQERFQSVISQLFQNRIIRCGGAVDDDMANLIVAQLLYLDAVDPTKDIIMYVNSPGGSVTAGMAIFDTMRHIRPDVSTVCVGLAASMGAFLLSAGTKGKRYSLPNSRIMIHQPLGGAQGQQTDIEIQANEILHHKANLNGYLAYHTGQSYDQIVQDTDRDFFMSATEAKEYGLIDAVITNPLKALNAAPVAA
ncbi:unnamed protein product [Closterium sp. Yama58-4]|nr:unnamed protein product [Closterium sp. Yama58-4]